MSADTRVTYEILIIDDDPDLRAALSDGIDLHGLKFNVTTAANGEEGIAAADRVLPDLVVVDYNLGDITGMDVLRRLRGDARHSSLRMIMLTAIGTRENLWESLDRGADDFVAKPFDLEELEIRMYQQLTDGRAGR